MTRISIGLPVYNGERYLEQTIDSILGQTHRDLELIISDNASTDGTEAICRRYAASDPRIRYIRQPVNQGAARNHNIVLMEATGPYYRMIGADDWMASTCLERCAAVLDEHPEVVLAWPETVMVDEEGSPMPYPTDQVWHDETPSSRLASMLVPRGRESLLEWSAPQYGLARLEDFRATFRIGSYGGADTTSMVRLAVRGHWRRIPEPLFFRRQHVENSTSTRTIHEIAVFMDPSARPGRSLPNIRRRLGFVRAVLEVPMSAAERLRCALVLVRVLTRLDDARAVLWDLRVLARELAGDARRALQPRHSPGARV